MRESRVCPTCGKPLPPDGSGCTACLLHLALETSSGGDRGDAPASDDASSPHRLTRGSRVGPYAIVEELGEGGMGVVYLAEQTEPIRRRVALKVIKHGMDTHQVVKRFEAERQALALMDHAAIARVHEAGETEAGRPYFAMEYVDGEPVTAFCDRHRLDTVARLELFTRICEGLQHAHQRGIIHRDIKPSNILVTETEHGPQPKIIDFGVAKATEQSLTDHSAVTALGMLLGTPEYMSPEQAELNPLDVDTRSDVYSLGVLLYELLTGALPFEAGALRNAAFDEVRRQIREIRPSRPSTRVGELGERGDDLAHSRRTNISTLSRRLSGDLDLITMKALEKDRERRYSSPIELASDIRRHLTDEPILARPPSVAYQLSKLVSRHRLPAALLLGFVIAAVGAAIVMGLLYRDSQSNLQRALQAESEAEQVSDFLVGVFEVSNPGEARGNSATARELLDNAAQRIENDLTDQPKVQATLMLTMGRVYRSLGLFDPAIELLGRSVERREALYGPDDETVAESLSALAGTQVRLARYEEGEQNARRALAIAEASENPTEASLAPLHVLQNLFWILHDYDQSLPIAERLVEASVAAHGEQSEEAAVAIRSLAIVNMAMDRVDDAERLYKTVIEIQSRLYDENHPAIAKTQLNLAELYRQAARYEEAESIYLDIQELESRIYEDNNPSRAFAFNNLGLVYKSMGRYDEAIEQLTTAVTIREASLPENHPMLAWTLDNLGLSYLAARRLEQAGATIQRALDIALVAVGPDNADTGIVMNNLALVRREQKRYAEAEGLLIRSLEINLKVFGREHSETASVLHNLGKLRFLLRRLEEAEQNFLESIEITTAIHGAEHPAVGSSKSELAYVLEELGRLDEAEAMLREGIRIVEAALGTDHPDVRLMRRNLERMLDVTKGPAAGI